MGTVSESGTLSTSSPYLQSATGYNSTGNYVTSETDQRGNETTYSINNANGLVNSVTDAKGNVTSYTYQSGSLLPLTVTSGNATVSYVYDSYKRLSQINHNGFAYGFTYDKFGNTSTIKVGNQTLVTNNYATGNGDLLSAVYGNGTTYSYGYDNYHRVTSLDINGTSAFQYRCTELFLCRGKCRQLVQ